MAKKKEQFNENLLTNLRRQVGAILHKESPTFTWEVVSSTEGSLIYFYCPELAATSEFAQALHTKEVQQTTNQKRLVINAQGEYLEHYGLSPKKLSQEFKGLFDLRGAPIPMT